MHIIQRMEGKRLKNFKSLENFIILIFVSSILVNCGICKPTIPPSTDTTVTHVIDSVAWHDSTIYHTVYKEIYNDYTDLLDTLRLSTTYSEFESYIDTTKNILKGSAKNKDIDIPVQIKWKEKIVYKDSVKIVEKPYPVEVEKIVYRHTFFDKLCWLISLLLIVYIGFRYILPKLLHG